MSRTKRTLSYGTESRVKVARSATGSKTKTKNASLLSGHTNVDNKTLSFAYRHMQITTTAGVPYHVAYRANSPFDPDPALGGASAYGFAQMATRYQKYYVKSARCTLISHGYNVTRVEPLVLMWVDNRSTYGAADINTCVGVCKANGGKMMQMGHVLGQARTMPIVRMNTKDIHRGGIGDEDNSALCSTNPVNESYFHIMVFPISVADLESTSDTNICVGIEYDVMFYDPVDQF